MNLIENLRTQSLQNKDISPILSQIYKKTKVDSNEYLFSLYFPEENVNVSLPFSHHSPPKPYKLVQNITLNTNDNGVLLYHFDPQHQDINIQHIREYRIISGVLIVTSESPGIVSAGSYHTQVDPLKLNNSKSHNLNLGARIVYLPTCDECYDFKDINLSYESKNFFNVKVISQPNIPVNILIIRNFEIIPSQQFDKYFYESEDEEPEYLEVTKQSYLPQNYPIYYIKDLIITNANLTKSIQTKNIYEYYKSIAKDLPTPVQKFTPDDIFFVPPEKKVEPTFDLNESFDPFLQKFIEPTTKPFIPPQLPPIKNVTYNENEKFLIEDSFMRDISNDVEMEPEILPSSNIPSIPIGNIPAIPSGSIPAIPSGNIPAIPTGNIPSISPMSNLLGQISAGGFKLKKVETKEPEKFTSYKPQTEEEKLLAQVGTNPFAEAALKRLRQINQKQTAEAILELKTKPNVGTEPKADLGQSIIRKSLKPPQINASEIIPSQAKIDQSIIIPEQPLIRATDILNPLRQTGKSLKPPNIDQMLKEDEERLRLSESIIIPDKSLNVKRSQAQSIENVLKQSKSPAENININLLTAAIADRKKRLYGSEISNEDENDENLFGFEEKKEVFNQPEPVKGIPLPPPLILGAQQIPKQPYVPYYKSKLLEEKSAQKNLPNLSQIKPNPMQEAILFQKRKLEERAKLQENGEEEEDFAEEKKENTNIKKLAELSKSQFQEKLKKQLGII